MREAEGFVSQGSPEVVAGTDSSDVVRTLRTDTTGRLVLGSSGSASDPNKAEDTAHTSGDVGTFVLGVRNDEAATSFSGTNGDYSGIAVDNRGVVFTRESRSGIGNTPVLTNVNDSASSVSILAQATNRRSVVIHNDSTEALFIKYGATASLTSYTYKIPPDGTWEMPSGVIYSGAIDGIWSADGSGAARITDILA